MKGAQKLFVTVAAAAALLALAAVLLVTSPPVQNVNAGELKTFSSEEELAAYIQQNVQLFRQYDYLFGGPRIINEALGTPLRAAQNMAEKTAAGAAQQAAAPEAKIFQSEADYSTTNIQVEGVDEGDIVKSDGRYLYVLSGNKAAIVAAYPAEKARILSEIAFAGQPVEAFINKDKLVVFGRQPDYRETFIRVYDTADKEKPLLKRDVTCRGNYVTSRMIGDYVYAIINAPVTWAQNLPEQKGENGNPSGQSSPTKVELPQLTIDGRLETVPPAQIHYFDYPDRNYHYTMVLAVNTQNDEEKVKRKTFLTGVSQNIYASVQNIYLTGAKAPDFRALSAKFLEEAAQLLPAEIQEKINRLKNSETNVGRLIQEVTAIFEDYLGTLSDREAAALADKILAGREKWQAEIARERDKTIIHKLAVADGEVTYRCSGEVPGHVLNQFSMDEYKGLFRIATTAQGFLGNWQPNTRNNIYVLDEGLQVIGRLQGLAPTERIYAARFMGDRAYLVTFRRIDPLFVIDLKDPRQPKLLGELKIPGYSDYLHPYDENHLIGIGKEIDAGPVPLPAPAPAAGEPAVQIWPPPPTREQGIKIALFDVSDPARPKETAKYVIPGDTADSAALRDHKAVLFSRPKNLLAIPVSFGPVYRIMDNPELSSPVPGIIAPGPKKLPYYQGWHGVYVFDLSLENGIRLKGKIAHSEGGFSEEKAAGPVKRSLYINDVLYTLSDRLLKMNDLGTLKELNALRLD